MKWITYSDENYHDLSSMTLPVMRKHCAHQRIEFKLYTELVDPGLDVYWNRISIAERELPGSGFLILSDADILYSRDFDWQAYVKEAPEDINIWVSSETKPHRLDVCLGFALYRECPWTFKFLEVWKFLGRMRDEKVGYYDTWNRHDQEAFNILHDWFSSVHKRVERIPERIIANRISSQENKDACIGFHYWGHAYKTEAIEAIRVKLGAGI